MLDIQKLARYFPAALRDRADSYLEALSVFFEIRDPRVLIALGPSGLRGLLLKRGDLLSLGLARLPSTSPIAK